MVTIFAAVASTVVPETASPAVILAPHPDESKRTPVRSPPDPQEVPSYSSVVSALGLPPKLSAEVWVPAPP